MENPNRAELIACIAEDIDTPGKYRISDVRHLLNIANPIIMRLYREFCHANRLPVQYPISTAERARFELETIARLEHELWKHYAAPEPENEHEKTA